MNRRAEPSTEEKQRFYAAMKPKWEEVATALAADRPPEWEGYRFEAEIVPGSEAEQFRIRVSFKDRVSNRDRGGGTQEDRRQGGRPPDGLCGFLVTDGLEESHHRAELGPREKVLGIRDEVELRRWLNAKPPISDHAVLQFDVGTIKS